MLIAAIAKYYHNHNPNPQSLEEEKAREEAGRETDDAEYGGKLDDEVCFCIPLVFNLLSLSLTLFLFLSPSLTSERAFE
jgi:hypothetical protein